MDLDHELKAIGKGCFVRYVGMCENSDLSNHEIAEIISNESNYTINSGRSRVSKIRSILSKGLKKQAFTIIIKSNVSSRILLQAEKLLGEHIDVHSSKCVDAMYRSAFKMPTVTKITSRTSSITNAFINSVIPVIQPSLDEIKCALELLDIDPENLQCAYCGDTATEWDHLRALVKNHRPTGYISEIKNLVPACGKCNQSKGNKPWNEWITSNAKLSPISRNISDLDHRVSRLKRYEEWGEVQLLDFEKLTGTDLWEKHWKHWELILHHMREAQVTAEMVRIKISGF